jgi:hypothetical protein
LYFKTHLETEKFYWFKQIEIHHIAKRVRNLLRSEIENLDKKEKDRPYIHLARKLEVSRKTVWSLAHGLAKASSGLIKRIEKLEQLND